MVVNLLKRVIAIFLVLSTLFCGCPCFAATQCQVASDSSNQTACENDTIEIYNSGCTLSCEADRQMQPASEQNNDSLNKANQAIYSQMNNSNYTVDSESTAFSDGDYRYTIDDSGDATIIEYTGTDKKLIIPSELNTYPVKSIESSSFKNCYSLEAVALPDSLTFIGCGAFENCTNLSSVYIPVNMKTTSYLGSYSYKGPFYGCSSLNDISFGDGIEEIPTGLFSDCSGITSITLPNTIKRLGAYSFSSCNNLISIVLPDTLTTIGSAAFYGCKGLISVNLPANISEIEVGAFENCINIEKIALPDSLTYIGCSAFENCTNLSSVYIPAGMKTDSYAGSFSYNGPFYGCSSLKDITFGEGTDEIPTGLLSDCTGFDYLIIPQSVNRIGERAFDGCTAFCIYCPYLSYASAYAIENGIEFYPITDYISCEDLVLDRNGSSFRGDLNNISSNGCICFNLDYCIKPSQLANISDLCVKIYIPKVANLLEYGLSVNGSASTNYAYDVGSNVLSVPVSGNSGSITFLAQIFEIGSIQSYAKLDYYLDGAQSFSVIGIINETVCPLTINTALRTPSSRIDVSGIAPASTEIVLCVDGSPAGNTVSSKSGSWASTVDINDPVNYSEHVISANCVHDSDEMTAKTTITYQGNAPSLKSLKVSYNENYHEAECELTGTSTTKPIIYFFPKEPYTFNAKFDNTDTIEKVYITSSRNNEKKYMEATYNVASSSYIATGYFDENDPYYVPGVIGVEYKLKNETPYVGQSTNWDYYYNSLPQEITGSDIKYNSNTDKKLDADVKLSKAIGELKDTELNMLVECFDEANDTNFKDFLGTLGETENLLSYTVYGYDDKKYVLNLDLNNPGTFAMLMHEVSSSEYLKLVISQYTQYDKYTLADELLLNLSAISTVTGMAYKTYGIIEDNNDLIRKINREYYNDEAARNSALDKADQLYHDKAFFTLVTTLLPLVVATCAVPLVGATMSLAPTILFTGLLSTMTSLSGTFWEMRENNILGDEYHTNWIVDPSGTVYDADTQSPLEGVSSSAYYVENQSGTWETPPAKSEYGTFWNASEYDQANPISTSSSGKYAWNVPCGWWRVKYEKEGYITAWSEWLPVPPPQTSIDVFLQPAEIENYTVTEVTSSPECVSILVSANILGSTKVTCVLAAYNDQGKILCLKQATKVLTDSNNISLTLEPEGLQGNVTVKVFVFDSETMSPLRSAWEKSL